MTTSRAESHGIIAKAREAVLDLFALTGRPALGALRFVGSFSLFAADIISHIFRPPFYPKSFFSQCLQIGYLSLPMVGLTALFTGGVLALQSYTGFSRFNAESSVASVVVISLTRELGPVLASLMVAGRAGAAIAAELGAMRVTQQIDALTTLSVHPLKYLAVPRLLAGVICLPLLTLLADVIGVAGGYLVGVHKLGFAEGHYLKSTFDYLEPSDVISGLAKSAVFGAVIALVGCYHGYYAEGGAAGVGVAVRSAVVRASIMILACNYIMTELFFR